MRLFIKTGTEVLSGIYLEEVVYPDEKLSNCIEINTIHNGPIKAFILSSADAAYVGLSSLYIPMR